MSNQAVVVWGSFQVVNLCKPPIPEIEKVALSDTSLALTLTSNPSRDRQSAAVVVRNMNILYSV